MSLLFGVVLLLVLGMAGASAAAPRPGQLDAVSCTSKSACTAVGESGQFPHQFALVERWNGRRWSVQAVPRPKGATETELHGVDCVTPDECFAAGEVIESTGAVDSFVVRWANGRWTVQHVPSSKSDAFKLKAISCASSTACTAVGSALPYSPKAGRPLVEQWDGTKWRVVHAPNPNEDPVRGVPEFEGVACTGAAACTAVGRFDTPQGYTFAFVERWDGTRWTRQPLPQPRRAFDSELWAVSCSTATSCLGGGTWFDGENSRVLAEGWNGERWHIQRAKPGDQLLGVSCRGRTGWCEAVGDASQGAGSPPLAEQWRGGRGWVTQRTADAHLFTQLFDGVSCPSRKWCMAVGWTVDGPNGSAVPFSERWDRSRPAGSRWSIVPVPS